MDVISMGDFKLINDGKTSFSIRTPSEGDAPFVADATEEAVPSDKGGVPFRPTPRLMSGEW